jgi:hypothetical protein
MDILQMSQADNDKQEIDRIISTVASPWILLSEFRKLLPSEIRETKQVMRFLQYFPLICTIRTQGCSQHHRAAHWRFAVR